jgi:hypothetical protein
VDHIRYIWSRAIHRPSAESVQHVGRVFPYRVYVGTLQTEYPAYKLQAKTRRRACIRTLPCVLRLRTLPPCRGGLRCCHVPHGSQTRLPTREGSGVAMCLTASVLPHVTRLKTLPPCSEGLQCCHVPHDSIPCLATQGGAPMLSCVP